MMQTEARHVLPIPQKSPRNRKKRGKNERNITNLPNPQLHHRPRPLRPLLPHPPDQLRKPLPIIILHNPTPAKQPQDPRTSLKAAEHNRHAAILINVRDGLGAGARGVDVGSRVGVEDREGGGGETFGGDVDVGACEGGGGGEEDGLG